jgi:hypothetical protein
LLSGEKFKWNKLQIPCLPRLIDPIIGKNIKTVQPKTTYKKSKDRQAENIYNMYNIPHIRTSNPSEPLKINMKKQKNRKMYENYHQAIQDRPNR